MFEVDALDGAALRHINAFCVAAYYFRVRYLIRNTLLPKQWLVCCVDRLNPPLGAVNPRKV